MSHSEQKQLEKFLKIHPDIEIFEAILPDINGNLRGKWIPRSKISKAFDGSLKIPRTTLGFDIWGRDVSSWVLDDGDADGILQADIKTLSHVPWLERPTGQILLSLNEVSGEPCAFDTRSILKKLVERLDKLELTPVVASEMEFHLFESGNDEQGRPLHTQKSTSGRST
ncbi:MAG: glutamine synthetase, partial [Kangiellaceae bacterium]|nr:glutamine synthetase [Kangiellaceae bacterium]